MQSLGVKKFFLDYLIGSVLIFSIFVLVTGNFTALNTRATFGLLQKCSLDFPAEEVLNSIQSSLREGERCEIVSPCDNGQAVYCEGTATFSEFYQSLYKFDSLLFRGRDALDEPYGVWRYTDSSAFRIPLGFIIILLFYGVVLAEAGALVFALWRQKKLKQTLSLPPGSKRDQLLKPVIFALLLAIVISIVNNMVFIQFDHPEALGSEFIQNLFKSASGIFIIVVLAPLAEELIFRGVLLRLFVERNKLILGTIIVSLLFSAVHGFKEQNLGWQLYISSMYFIISIFLCRLYIKQKNLWSPIVFHCVYNSTLVVLANVFS